MTSIDGATRDIAAEVREEILAVYRDTARPPRETPGSALLGSDLGLDSLDLARSSCSWSVRSASIPSAMQEALPPARRFALSTTSSRSMRPPSRPVPSLDLHFKVIVPLSTPNRSHDHAILRLPATLCPSPGS